MGHAASQTRVAEVPDVLRFVIDGEPVPKARSRHRIVFPKSGGKPFTQEYTDAKTKAYEDRVRLLAKVAANGARWGWSDGDRFSIVLRIVRTYWDKGGDLDNVLKSCFDGMNGVIFADDRYVRAFGAAFLPPDPKRPRVEVEVRRFPKGAA